jgi:hypothetical protein
LILSEISMIEIIDDDERIEHVISGCAFTLRRLTPDDQDAIARRNTKRIRGRSGEWQKEADQNAMLMDMIDHAVVTWTGVRHPVTKADVPCNSENKRKLPLRVMEEIMEVVTEANLVEADEAQGELKNSKGSSA